MTLFTLSAVFSVALILVATFLGIRSIYTDNVIKIAEQQSVNIADALFVQELDLLSGGSPDDARSLAIVESSFGQIDRRMHDYLRPFNIVKIKVFNTGGVIIYSTDPSIIGVDDNRNERLNHALAGRVDAEFGTKDRIVDLTEEERFDIDVVETYVPVTNRSGAIIGAFEIYMDVTQYREKLAGVLRSSILVIGAVLLVAFGILFLIMRKGTRQLSLYELELHAMAVTDALTGIANRRFLLDRAEEEFLRVQRDRQRIDRPDSAGCILIDIDHFKRINDNYGHQVGDDVLREVAVRLKESVRRYDLVGRYGGEEFLIVAPNSDRDHIREVAERVWNAIRERPIDVGELALQITISVGFACVQPGDAGIEDVIQRADQGLYKAKDAGRDQIARVSAIPAPVMAGADAGSRHGRT